ncbi:MAG TPA: FKBP-type peptidyl-prolyl cis-trans isomerase [Longimicrobiaceae bacterium]|nr:FKBP-type peptidyl-prolyl cis-trans isomerase [Longimicrobiaceae bacterium]
MTKNKLGAALAAVAVLALAGCLDSDPLEPALQCTLDPTPDLEIAGDTVTTSTGLKYIRSAPAADPEAATVQATSVVDVCYVGFLTNGQVFDGGTRTFDLNGNLIAGFKQGVTGMKVGETRRLIIPPALGYGAEPARDPQGNIVIPANSTIIFDVGVLRLR